MWESCLIGGLFAHSVAHGQVQDRERAGDLRRTVDLQRSNDERTDHVVSRENGKARLSLSRARIIAAALAYIDEHGAQGLTMRQLGGAIGVEAMSLYRHVEGREDLLEGVVSEVTSGLTAHMDAALGGSWQGYLQDLAHRCRAMALAHPHVFPLVATKHPAAPWLRPPLRDLALVEHFLATLSHFGFTPHQAVAAYQSFSSFLLGHLLLEVVQLGAETSPVELPLDEGEAQLPSGDAGLDLAAFPAVAAAREELSRDTSREQFEISLEALLDRLELALKQ